jgi:hypothetical protein
MKKVKRPKGFSITAYRKKIGDILPNEQVWKERDKPKVKVK